MSSVILYSSKYGSTKEISERLADRLGSEISAIGKESRLEKEINLNDFDLVVLGSPIYEKEPLENVTRFIRENRELLSTKRMAAFIVYLDLLKKDGKPYGKIYLDKLVEYLPDKPIVQAAFGGRITPGRLSKEDRKILLGFYKNDAGRMEDKNYVDSQKIDEFSKRLRSYLCS